jgi:hypothetical protein
MASTAAGVLVSRPNIFSGILLAGAVGGGFDAVYAIVYFGLTRGIHAYRIFQHIATGLLGPDSFSLGWKSVLLGVICHFTIAIGAAATYASGGFLAKPLIRNPKLCGPIFGLGIYLFMNFVVVPLSRVTVKSGPSPLDVIITGVSVHMFLIGLPIAMIVSAALNRRLEEPSIQSRVPASNNHTGENE